MTRPMLASELLSPEGDDILTAERIERDAWIDQFEGAPRAFAQAVGLTTRVVDGATLLLAPGLPLTLFNRVLDLGHAQPIHAEQLAAIDAAYRESGVGRFWVHTTPLSRGVGQLAAHGYRTPARARWSKMLRDTAPVDAHQLGQAARSEVVAREARPHESAEVASAIACAHGVPPAVADWVRALAARTGWTLFGAFLGERVIGGACLFERAGCGWLGLGGTVAAHRRCGAQGQLMRVRIDAARERGLVALGTETGEPMDGEHNPSLANMQRAGFRRVCSRANHERALISAR